MANKRALSSEVKNAILADLAKRYTLKTHIEQLEDQLTQARTTLYRHYGYKILASKYGVCLQTICNFKRQYKQTNQEQDYGSSS